MTNDSQIYISLHPDDEKLVKSVLKLSRAAGWDNVVCSCDIGSDKDGAAIADFIRQSDLFVVFLSKTYASDDNLMLEEFAYASTIIRKPFLPVWLDSLEDIRRNSESGDHQLLCALEMLTAKHTGVTADHLVAALEAFVPDTSPYTPSTPQICEKPCEAYEGSGTAGDARTRNLVERKRGLAAIVRYNARHAAKPD